MMQRIFRIGVFSLLPLFAAQGSPWSGVLETGETVGEGWFTGTAETFIAYNHGGQFNPLLKARYGFLENLDAEAFLATGTTELQIGTGGKWMILPDVEGQVALGLATTIRYALDSAGQLLWEFHPVVSNRFRMKKWSITPFGSFQTGFAFGSTQRATTAVLNIVAGAKLNPPGFESISFTGELGISVYRSAHYIAVSATIAFEDISDPGRARLP